MTPTHTGESLRAPSRRTVVPGAYQLLIRLRTAKRIRVGALGLMRFAPGWYVYSGSARGGVTQRVARHLRRGKRLHWHIDYLLARADRVKAFVSPGLTPSECDLHAGLDERQREVPRFGCSDCRCASHLAYFPRRPSIHLAPFTDSC